jgi:hypothetical protein
MNDRIILGELYNIVNGFVVCLAEIPRSSE